MQSGAYGGPPGLLVLPHFAGAATPYMDSGSRGAIVGLCEDGAMFESLKEKLGGIGCRVLRPKVATKADETAEIASTGWRNS